jgi:hypothetical protein
MADGVGEYELKDLEDEYDGHRAFAYNEILYKHLGTHE